MKVYSLSPKAIPIPEYKGEMIYGWATRILNPEEISFHIHFYKNGSSNVAVIEYKESANPHWKKVSGNVDEGFPKIVGRAIQKLNPNFE